jgi:hypothetical protein
MKSEVVEERIGRSEGLPYRKPPIFTWNSEPIIVIADVPHIVHTTCSKTM